jgi:hypothetical protein
MEPEAVAVAINIDETAAEPSDAEIPPWLLEENAEHALAVTDAVYTGNPPPVPHSALAVNEFDEEAEWGADAEELGSGLGAPLVSGICGDAEDAVAVLPAANRSNTSAAIPHKSRRALNGRCASPSPRVRVAPSGIAERLRSYGAAILEHAEKAKAQ